MKKTVFAILALFAITGLFAQQQPVVAVAPFDAISGISATDAAMITRVFFIRLGNTQKVSLVDRNVVDRVLLEHSFQLGDWSNQQKTAELGKALNSDWIVRGELEKFGENILVTVQFYDIKTFRFMGGSDILLANAAEAMDKMDPLVNKLVETIAANSGGRNVSVSSFYGVWSNESWTVTIEPSRILQVLSFRGQTAAFNMPNGKWLAEKNNFPDTREEYPIGLRYYDFSITEGNRGNMIFIFMHRSDNNKMYLYAIQNNNIQKAAPLGPLKRVH